MSSVPKSDDQRPPNPHDETIVNSKGGSGSAPPGSGSGFSLHPSLHEQPQAVQTVDEFSKNLTDSGLMSAAELQSFYDTIRGRDSVTDAAAFAELLIKSNKLTPYQAESLRLGHTRGLVLGNYVILDKLGEGGMGMVFKARHRLMKRIVALKVLPPSLTQSPDAVDRFHREVEAAAKLTHANIAGAHDADQADGIHFLVMEYVDGANLSALVKKFGPLSPPVAMNILAQAARGLAHAHAQGVVHRDIKPSNLVVGRDGLVKVLDLGLAQLQMKDQNDGAKADLTQSGRIMGTVDYMAPEQALDAKNVDRRADIYSLGCTLFYLLAARPLAPEGTLTQKLLWHQSEPVPALRSVSPEAPEELETLFARMVAKRPGERPQSMDEVVAQLEALLAKVPPEQLVVPFDCGALSADGGSSHGTKRNRPLTMVDRATQAEFSDEATLHHGSLPVSPAPRRSWLLPATLALALGGVGIGIGIFAFFLAPPPEKKNSAAAAAADGTKVIVISSEPNARVFVNNKPEGETSGVAPFQAELILKPGTHQLRVEKAGFKAFGDKITIKEGKAQTYSAELGPLPASVEIVTDIAGVSVIVDDRERGTTTGKDTFRLPLSVEPGQRTFRFAAEGYESKEEPLAIASGEKFTHRVSLAERPHRQLLTWIFKSAPPETEAPVTLEVSSGEAATPKRWSDVPPKYLGIRAIDLAKAPLDASDVAQLAKLEMLSSLSLADTKLNDEGAKHLAALKNLDTLDLSNTQITNNALSRLKQMSKLRELNLRGTKIDDTGLESLTGLPLETLHLSGTGVTDKGVKKLAAVKTLRQLSVDGTAVTEEGYNALNDGFAQNPIDIGDLDRELSLARRLLRGGASISYVTAISSAEPAKEVSEVELLPQEKFHITAIHARGSQIVNDALLPQFKDLPKLDTVDLDGSAVTDVGLAHLRTMKTLTKVNLGYLRISKDIVGSLRQELPDAEVKWEGPRDRVAAEWVLAQGGQVRVSAGASKLAKKLEELPSNQDFRVTEIHLANKPELPAEELAAIKDLSDLALLNLSGTKVTESTLREMTGCLRVRTLAVSGPDITSGALAAIVERFPALERLFVTDSAVTGASLHLLKNLPQLTHLSLAGTQLADEDLLPLAALPQLQWLSLDAVPITDAAVPTLTKIKTLKMLSLEDKFLVDDEMMAMLPAPPERAGSLQITDAGIEELQKMLGAQHVAARALDGERLAARWLLEQGGSVVVTLDGTAEEKVDRPGALPRQACHVVAVTLKSTSRVRIDELAAKLRSCKQLRSLDLSGMPVEDKHLKSLSALESLTSLNLADTLVSDGAFENLGQLANLRVLGLQGTLVTGEGLAKAPLPNLTHLYAGTSDVTDRTLPALKDCTSLVVLDLSNCKGVTDKGVSALAGLTSLERLDLSLTRVSDASAPTIAKFTKLRRLNLHGLAGVSDTLVAQLKGLEQLEEINLARTKVTDAAFGSLASHPNLKKVTIFGTAVTDGGAKPLIDRGLTVIKSDDPAKRDQNNPTGSFGAL